MNNITFISTFKKVLKKAQKEQKLTYIKILLLDSYYKIKKLKSCPFCFFSIHALGAILSRHTGISQNTIKHYLDAGKSSFIIKIIDTIENTGRTVCTHNCNKNYMNTQTGGSLIDEFSNRLDHLGEI
jgi:hypothetical protein